MATHQTVEIIEGPLPDMPRKHRDGAGGVVVFEGVVRPTEGGDQIAGLDYEVYSPMAERQLADLCASAIERFGLLGLDLYHSRGFVPAGAVSLRVVAHGEHRAECLDAVGWTIDELKKDVAIWKMPRSSPTASTEAGRGGSG